MELREAMEVAWQKRSSSRAEPLQILQYLEREIDLAIKAVKKGERWQAERSLEEAVGYLFIAMKLLGVDVEKALASHPPRMGQVHQLMKIRPNKVEIYTDGALKGDWPIWSEEDIVEAQKIARRFGFEVQMEGDE